MQSGFWSRFRDWRRSRPFWGGLFTLLAGLEIVYLPLSPISQIIAAGVAGVQSILVGFLIIVMGLFIWFSPPNRLLAGVLTIIFSVSSLVLSNLGGLVVGMLAGIIGGALTVSWTDQPRPPRKGGGGRDAAAEETPDAGMSIVDQPRKPSPRPQAPSLSRRPRGRRATVLAVLVTLTVAWSSPAAVASEPAEPQPTRDCIDALAALPADLLRQLLPGLPADLLERLLPELPADLLGQLLPGLQELLPGLPQLSRLRDLVPQLSLPLLGAAPSPAAPAPSPAPASSAPAPEELTAAELWQRQEAAAQKCTLPQLLPVGGPAGGEPLLPLPRLPGLPLPELPLPDLPLPQLPNLPRLPLPELPLLPDVPRVPFPPLPGLPGLPGVDPPGGPSAPPLPIAPRPDDGQTVFAAEDGDVAPATTSDLTMDTLDVTSLVYQGIVELPTAAGGTVRALRFHMATIDADTLKIHIPTHTGRMVDLEHTPGNHVLGTDVTLDCTKLSLNAFGLLPLTFTVDTPPPSGLAIPVLASTDVDIDLVTLKLAELLVPTAEKSLSGPGTDPDPDPAPAPQP